MIELSLVALYPALRWLWNHRDDLTEAVKPGTDELQSELSKRLISKLLGQASQRPGVAPAARRAADGHATDADVELLARTLEGLSRTHEDISSTLRLLVQSTPPQVLQNVNAGDNAMFSGSFNVTHNTFATGRVLDVTLAHSPRPLVPQQPWDCVVHVGSLSLRPQEVTVAIRGELAALAEGATSQVQLGPVGSADDSADVRFRLWPTSTNPESPSAVLSVAAVPIGEGSQPETKSVDLRVTAVPRIDVRQTEATKRVGAGISVNFSVHNSGNTHLSLMPRVVAATTGAPSQDSQPAFEPVVVHLAPGSRSNVWHHGMARQRFLLPQTVRASVELWDDAVRFRSMPTSLAIRVPPIVPVRYSTIAVGLVVLVLLLWSAMGGGDPEAKQQPASSKKGPAVITSAQPVQPAEPADPAAPSVCDTAPKADTVPARSGTVPEATWTVRAGAPFYAAPLMIAASGLAVAANDDGRVYAVDAASGILVARTACLDGASAAQPSTVGNNLVLALTDSGSAYLFRLDAGSLNDNVTSPPIAIGGRAVLKAAADRGTFVVATRITDKVSQLLSIRAADRVVIQGPMVGNVSQKPSIVGDSVYVANDTATIVGTSFPAMGPAPDLAVTAPPGLKLRWLAADAKHLVAAGAAGAAGFAVVWDVKDFRVTGRPRVVPLPSPASGMPLLRDEAGYVAIGNTVSRIQWSDFGVSTSVAPVEVDEQFQSYHPVVSQDDVLFVAGVTCVYAIPLSAFSSSRPKCVIRTDSQISGGPVLTGGAAPATLVLASRDGRLRGYDVAGILGSR